MEAADDLGIIAPDFGTSKGKAYEVWVMLEIVARLLQRGVEVSPDDCDDEVEPLFRVAGSPTGMPSHTAKGAPCHFKLERAGTCLELHLGLNHEGVSTTTHEIDLCVIPMHLAYFLRHSGGGPYRGPVRLGLELKAYGARHKLPHDIPRALLGVAIDLDPCWPVASWTFHTFGGGDTTLTRSGRNEFALVTATQFHTSSETLLSHHGVAPYAEVRPGLNEAALELIVDEVEAMF